MNEKFLSYIWQHKLFNQQEFLLSSGEKVQVIHPGELNQNAGPDFFNAKIKMGNTTWAGNVEIHVNASDWYKHKHDEDKNYGSIILHVVLKNDKPVYRKSGEIIPCIELNFYPSVYENYLTLFKPKNTIKCAGYLNAIDPFHIQLWIEQLAIERLSEKISHIQSVLQRNKNNWEETFYQLLAYSFGLKINHYPFEQLAIGLPNKILAKHKNQLFQVEALLFGRAGFLNDNSGDEYYLKMRKEYGFLQKKIWTYDPG